jgi:hypothetical protein
VALVNREADIDAWRDAGAEAHHATQGLPPVAKKIGLRAGRKRKAINLAPASKARPFDCFRGTAAAGIIAQRPPKAAGGLVAKPLEETAAEIKNLGA